jgi:hypothetical protein
MRRNPSAFSRNQWLAWPKRNGDLMLAASPKSVTISGAPRVKPLTAMMMRFALRSLRPEVVSVTLGLAAG